MNDDHRAGLVTCSISMRLPPENLGQAVKLMASTVERTEAKAGCRECAVMRDEIEKDLVHYHERWESESAFQRHLRSEEFRRVLIAMDMSSEEPQVIVGNLKGQRGLAYIEGLRDREKAGNE